MIKCTLCGNEEIEKPVIRKLVKMDSSFEMRNALVIEIPFGRTCWNTRRKACLAKINEIAMLEGIKW